MEVTVLAAKSSVDCASFNWRDVDAVKFSTFSVESYVTDQAPTDLPDLDGFSTLRLIPGSFDGADSRWYSGRSGRTICKAMKEAFDLITNHSIKKPSGSAITDVDCFDQLRKAPWC